MEVTMPKFEETSDSAVVVKWLKQPGEQVARGDELVEVETEKFSHPVESPVDGVLASHAVNEGAEVQVGAVLAIINDAA